MIADIYFDGRKYISAAEASHNSGLSRDYIGRLCRDGKVLSRRIGKGWFVEDVSFQKFLIEQEYAKSIRREELSRVRTNEYNGVAPTNSSKPSSAKQDVLDTGSLAHTSRFLKSASPRTSESTLRRTKIADYAEAGAFAGALAREGSFSQKVASFSANPRITDALRASVQSSVALPSDLATPIIHVPTHVITPVVEFAHRLVALTLAFMLTFGTYALVDQQYARYAMSSIERTSRSIVSTLASASLAAGSVSSRSESALSLAASDPRAFAAAATTAVSGSIARALTQLAQVVNLSVDSAVYAVVYPQELISDTFASPGTRGVVAVDVKPYAAPHTYPQTSQSGEVAIANPSTPVRPQNIVQTIVNQPVIERIVSNPVAVAGGISQSYLDQRLQELDNKLSSRMYSLTSANSTTIAQNYNVTAQSNAINQLSHVAISDSTITGGTISGVSISGGSLSISDAAISGSLTADSVTTSATSTLAGIQISGIDCSLFGNSGKLTTDSSGNVVCSDDYGSAGGAGSPGGANGLIQFNDVGSFGGDTGFSYNKTTDRLSVVNASTTALTAFTAAFGGSATSSFASNGALTLSQALAISSGGTGTTTVPTYGTLLVGNNAGGYDLIATSSLGILSGGSWGSITGTLSSQTDLQAAFDAKLSLSAWYATTTDALAQGSTNKYYSDTAVNTLINSSSTIVKSNAAPTYGQVLIGNSSGGFTLMATSTLGLSGGGGGSSVWGSFTGTLSDQTDLQAALDARLTLTNWYATTTSALAEGSNLYFTNARVNDVINASTTIPKTTLANIWNPLQTFTNGFVSQASSTIGDGTQAGGLTISGGATTTANAYFGGNVGIGTQSAQTALDVVGNAYIRNAAGTVGSNDAVEIATDASAPRVSLLQGGRSVGLFSADAPGNLYIKNTAGGATLFYGGSGGNVENARFTNDGFLGIGTSSPWKMLSVAGDIIGTNITATGTLAVAGNTTLANATTTTIYSTTASSTNLFAQTAQFGSLSILGALTQTGLGTFANGFVSQASSTVVGNFTSTGIVTGASFTGAGTGLTGTASSLSIGGNAGTVTDGVYTTTFNGLFDTRLGTKSTTDLVEGSNLYFTNARVNDVINASTTIAKTTLANIWNPLQTFANGFVSQASSTIGDGTQTGGLTISGGATTTANAYFGGNVSIGASGGGMFPILFDAQKDQNNGTIARVRNDTNDTGASAQFIASLGDYSQYVGLGTFPSSYTTNGLLAANSTALYSSGATNGLRILSFDSAPLTLGTNNTARLTIDTSGNIGIGTTSPWKMLSVAGDIIGTNLTATGTLAVSGNTTLGSATSTNFFSTTASSTNLFAQTAAFGSLTLGTPLVVSSGGTGITSFGSGIATFLGTPSSANLATALTDETGTGSAVFSASPTFTGTAKFANASSTSFSNFGTAYFGGTATTTIDSSGAITVTSGSKNTFPYASTTALTVSGNAYFPSGIWNSSGYLGVGTTSPFTNFAVAGSGYFSNALTVAQTLTAGGNTQTSIGPSTWVEQTASGSRNWTSVTSSADGTKLAAVNQGGYIYTSTDSGATWTEQTAAGSRFWQTISSSADGTKLAAVNQGGYIYTSTDSGATWTEQTAAGSRDWYSITSSSDGTKLAATVFSGYIYTSIDSGATWTEQTAAGSRFWLSITSSADGTKLSAVPNSGYIYTSTDSGATWTEQTASGNRSWVSVTSSSDGTKLAATVFSGYIYTSTDSGATWTEQTASGSRVWQNISSSADGTKLATVVLGGYIYTSTDSGATWTEQTAAGSGNWYYITSSSDGTKLAAVLNSNSVWTYGPSVVSITNPLLNVSDNVSIGTSTAYARFSVWGAGTGTGILSEWTNSASTTVARFLDNGTAYLAGNVGIGTTTPGSILSIQGVGNFVANATSTLYNGLKLVGNLDVAGAATSTFANGLNITTGCFSVNGTCLTSGTTPTGTTGQLGYFSDTNTLTGTSTLFLATNGNVGIGTTTPYSKFTVWGTGTTTGMLSEWVNSASTTVARIFENGASYFLGNVGIGTTTPSTKLGVQDPVSTGQLALAYDAADSSILSTNSLGNLVVLPSGNNMFLPNTNLWVCTGGSISSSACPSGTPTGQGNLIVQNKIGVASSTPFSAIAVGTNGAITTTEKSLTDSATITIDWTQGNQQLVTLAGSRTIAFTNYIPGAALRLVVCQDATGSRALTWPAVVLWNSGTAPTLTTTANKCDVLTFITTAATGTVKVLGTSVLNF